MQNTREENRDTNMFFKVKADKLPSTSGYAYAVKLTKLLHHNLTIQATKSDK